MKIVAEIYDFVTGGSIVAPAGCIVAIAATILCGRAFGSSVAQVVLVGTLVLTFVGCAFERPS